MSQRQENSGDPDREERIRHLPGRNVQERHFSFLQPIWSHLWLTVFILALH